MQIRNAKYIRKKREARGSDYFGRIFRRIVVFVARNYLLCIVNYFIDVIESDWLLIGECS